MNSPSINFGFQFVCDGSSTTVEIDLTSGPVFYNLPAGTGTSAFNGGFNATAKSATGVEADSGLTVDSWNLGLDVLTVNFSGDLPDPGTVCTVNGTLLF